jgi:hypothetical protein
MNEMNWIAVQLSAGRSVRNANGIVAKPHTKSTGHNVYRVVCPKGSRYDFGTAIAAARFAVSGIAA